MIVVDTGVLTDALRDVDTAATRALRSMLDERRQVAITDIVYAELIVGVRSSAERRAVDQIADLLPMLYIEGIDDVCRAARCRRASIEAGMTVRSLTDCLIASICIRENAELLHCDRDFERLARCTDLRSLHF